MPKQFVLDERFGDRGAVDRDERFVAARGQVMDSTGEQFFAGSGFTQQQHIGFGLRDALRFSHRAFDRFAFTDDARKTVVLGPLFTQQNVFRAQTGLFQRAFYQQQQMIRIDRLLQKVVGAIFHCLDGFINRTKCRHHDHRYVRVGRARCA